MPSSIKYELPLSLFCGLAAPLYWHLVFPYGGHSRHDIEHAAECLNVAGKSFLLALIAAFCLSNARKVRATTGWMKAWSVLLNIWMAFTLGGIFFVWWPQLR